MQTLSHTHTQTYTQNPHATLHTYEYPRKTEEPTNSQDSRSHHWCLSIDKHVAERLVPVKSNSWGSRSHHCRLAIEKHAAERIV
jgi:hypothetical protein